MENNTQNEFEARLEAIREATKSEFNSKRLRSDMAINDALRKESISTLNAMVRTIEASSKLEEDSIIDWAKGVRTTKMAKEYGRIPALIFIITKSFAWPIEDKADAREIPDIQEEINDALSDNGLPILDIELVLDINESKGYHSFMTDDGEEKDAVEPDYEQLDYSLTQFCETFDVPFIDYRLKQSAWNRKELLAVADVANKTKANKDALDRQAALNEA